MQMDFANGLHSLFASPGRDVALVHHHGHAADGRAENDRHADKTALGKDDIRLQLADDPDALERTCDDAERIGEILPVEIAAQLAGADRSDRSRPGIGSISERSMPFLCADVVDIPALVEQMGMSA